MVENKAIGRKILSGTITIVWVGILAKLASFLTDAILAAYLGTSYQSDAYYMIWGIHAVIYPMLSIGIWQVFLPIYKSHHAKNELNEAFSLTNKTLTFFSLISLFVVILLVIFSPIVVSIVAPGFKDETRELSIYLVRLSAPQYVFIIASAVYAAILQSHEKFFGSQIREIVSYIPTIIAALLFYKKYGTGVLAFSLTVAAIFRLLVELPFVDWGYRYRPDFHYQGKEFSLMLKRLPSALISSGVTQLNTLIDKAMASTLPAGAVSGLNYGHKLMNVLSGFVSSAIATALYPQMVELIALKKKDELSSLITKIVNIFSIIMFPVTIACILFRTELVSAVFQRGAFDDHSTALTAGVFALYSLGVFFIACNTVVSNAFYGYGDTKTPMFISIANLVINVVLNLILIHLWGVNGLALATSLSAIITFLVRVKMVEKYVQLDNKRMIVTAVKVLIASAIACMIPRAIFWLHPINRYLTLIISAIIGVVVYLLAVKILRVDEIKDLVGLLKLKMKKT